MSASNEVTAAREASLRAGRARAGAFRMLGRPDEEITVWLCRAYAELGDAAFTQAGYRRWRQAQIELRDEPIPSAGQLCRFYGSFSEAAQAAIPQLPRRGRRLAGPERVRAHETAAAYADRKGSTGLDAEDERTRSVTGEQSATSASASPSASDSASCLQPVLLMLDRLPFEAVRELERALRRRLHPAGRPASARRVERLGFLAQLLAAQPLGVDGRRIVERQTYERQRPADAPSAERLQHAYGSWAAACRAAAGVLDDGRKRNVGPTGAWCAPPALRATTDDVRVAVRRCADELGRRPSSHDFHSWGIEKRARARAAGRREPIPAYNAVCRLYRARAERAGTRIWAAVIDDVFGTHARESDADADAFASPQ